MRLFRHYAGIPGDARGGVVAVGNFDGVHCGHQVLLASAREAALAAGVPLGVLTFEPHPRRYFQPDTPPFRLTPLRIKARHLAAFGVDVLYVLAFDNGFSRLSAAEFVKDVLVDGLGVAQVVVGADFCFGRKRQGNADYLRAQGADRGFGVDIVAPVADGGGAVYSSSAIRQHLREGRPAQAADLLGHLWEIEGRVLIGDQRGRTIGFPTANVALGDYLPPARGVYAVRAGVDTGDSTKWLDGVANFGVRPTVDGTNLLLEVHLFDFDGDLYGRHLRVALVDFIRAEQKFAGLEALKSQIAADAKQARALLAAMSWVPGVVGS
ncbi:MAG: bifunctional riboflavin kinase/FAD synthetase [Alphaproteobacteria bacterium]